MARQEELQDAVAERRSITGLGSPSLLSWMLITTTLLFLMHLAGALGKLSPITLILPSLFAVLFCAAAALLAPLLHRILDLVGSRALEAGAIPVAKLAYWLIRGAAEVPAYYRLGECCLAAGAVQKSIREFTLALKHDRVGHYGLGSAYLEEGDWRHALDHFTQALREERRCVPLESIYFSMALAYAELGEPIEAMNAMFAYLEHGGDPFLAHVLLGQLYDETHDPSQAVTHYRKAMELASDSAEEPEILRTIQARLRALTGGE